MKLINLFRPKWKHSLWSIRLSAIQKLTNKELLAKIAISDKDMRVRKATVVKIDDIKILSKILNTDYYKVSAEQRIHFTPEYFISKEDKDLCKFVIDRITDQSLICNLAINARYDFVKSQAIEKLTDQMLLWKVACHCKSQSDGKAIVEKLTDQKLLEKLVFETKDYFIRLISVKKILDQKILSKIALEDKDSSVRATAVENLTDQISLAKIAVVEDNDNIRKAAVAKLFDQNLLSKIALEDRDSNVRTTAIEKLTDQIALAKIAIESKDYFNRNAAVKKLIDKVLLAKIALEDKDAGLEAFKKLDPTDKVLLIKLALESNCKFVRRYAIEKRNLDQTTLAKISIKDEDHEVRNAAVVQLTDQKLLEEVAVNAPIGKTCILFDNRESPFYQDNTADYALIRLTDSSLREKIFKSRTAKE